MEKDMYFISQDIHVFSCIFCKECHEYLYTHTPIPEQLMCGCLHVLMDVD